MKEIGGIAYRQPDKQTDKQMDIFDYKVCVLDLVQLEDDIGNIKSSHTDLSSSNWTRSKTQTLVATENVSM